METFRVIATDNPDESFGDSDEEEDGYDYSEVGYLPTRTTTGGIAFGLLQSMEYVPSATLFEAAYIADHIPFPPPDSIEGSQSLHVQTFVDGTRTLIHCWTNGRCNLFRFGRHDGAYGSEWDNCTEDPCLTKGGSIEHGYDFSPYNKPGLVDTTGVGVTGTTGVSGPFEFTRYQGNSCELPGPYGGGWHLPLVLLDYIYSQTEYERMPPRGQIGLTLPPHVWQVLDDWYEGVQSLIVNKSPSSELHTPADGPKSAAQVLTMEPIAE